MEKKITLSKSKSKNKRFKITMEGFPNMKPHSHEFGSSNGKTFIDNATEKQKSNWVARHSTNKNYNSKHSPIFYSRNLLWETPNLKKNIKLLAKKLKSKIIVKL
jgi:hypothetical protein